ncbi:MAG TPA: peptidoglycan-binding protein [Microlunatus sp.]
MTSVTGALAAFVLVGCGELPSDMARPAARASSAAPSKAASSSAPTTSAAPSGSASTKPTATASSSKSGAKPKTTASSKPAAKKTTQAPAKILFEPGDDGQQVRELQARLKQIGWYAGDVTSHYGGQTASAVKGFQDKRDLPKTGVVDETTWAKLAAMTKEPTHNELYNIQPAGPAIMAEGDSGTKIKQLQARLAQLAWFNEQVTGYYGPVTSQAVQGFQDKRGLPSTGDVDQKTWDRLVGMTEEPTKEELSGSDQQSGSGGSTSNLDQRCLTGRAMCIDKTMNQLTWVIDGKPQLHFDVRFGADTSPTREGAFSVGWKAKDWTSTLYHSEMPYSMFFSGGQAVHYSSDFAARGYAGASHGCVNVRDLAGIQSLFGQAQVGDKVIVYRS